MHRRMRTHTSEHLIIVTSNKIWMMDGSATCSGPNRKAEFSHPAPPISCSLLWKVCRRCVLLMFSSTEDKTTGGLSKGVSGLTLTTSGETRSKIYRYITAPSAPGRVWFHPAQSLHSLYGCVLPERLNNGRHQSTSEGPLPSSCTVKLILIEIDYSIWETWVINF